MPSSLQDSNCQSEMIAALVDESLDLPLAPRDFVATGTMLLVRHADGRMALESTRTSAAWAHQVAINEAATSESVVDPLSRGMGYEIEMEN